MNKQEYIAKQIEAVEAATARGERTLADAREALANAERTLPVGSDEVKARRDAVKSAMNRIDENARLLRFMNSDDLSSLCFVHKFDFAALTTERGSDSRECKKRFLIVMQALSVNNPEALAKAEFAYFAALASGRLSDTHSLAQAQSAMNHKTNTQARYMRSFLAFFKASKVSDTQTIAFDRDSATARKILALFA